MIDDMDSFWQEVCNRLYIEVRNYCNIMLGIIRNEGNARVCHLAKHAKKARTKRKNLRRAYRILRRIYE